MNESLPSLKVSKNLRNCKCSVLQNSKTCSLIFRSFAQILHVLQDLVARGANCGNLHQHSKKTCASCISYANKKVLFPKKSLAFSFSENFDAFCLHLETRNLEHILGFYSGCLGYNFTLLLPHQDTLTRIFQKSRI